MALESLSYVVMIEQRNINEFVSHIKFLSVAAVFIRLTKILRFDKTMDLIRDLLEQYCLSGYRRTNSTKLSCWLLRSAS
jgi:hypothetical protein